MSATSNIPYSSIIQQFRDACNANISVATFDTGTIDFLDANAVNKNYPYIYLRPISSPGAIDRIRTLTFELYSMDVPKLSDESPVNTLSQCEERIYQIAAWFNFGTKDIQQTYEVTLTDLSPVNEAFQDRVYGWVATIEVTTPWNFDYCNYPQITPTATAVPTATPTPSPTPFGQTPTATPIPTATPLPTATATGTPLPTPPPSPTPSPTAAPTFFSFLIEDVNNGGSLGDTCDIISEPDTQVYTAWEDEIWPDRIVGKEIYSDSALTTVYDTNAIFDGTTNRLVSSGSVYTAIELQWSNGTVNNTINTALDCAYPELQVNAPVNETYNSLTVYGQVNDFAGRNLDNYAFYFGTSLESINQVVYASYVNEQSIFSASIDNLVSGETYYIKAGAQDTVTDFVFKSENTETGSFQAEELAEGFEWMEFYSSDIDSGGEDYSYGMDCSTATFASTNGKRYWGIVSSSYDPNDLKFCTLKSQPESTYPVPDTISYVYSEPRLDGKALIDYGSITASPRYSYLFWKGYSYDNPAYIQSWTPHLLPNYDAYYRFGGLRACSTAGNVKDVIDCNAIIVPTATPIVPTPVLPTPTPTAPGVGWIPFRSEIIETGTQTYRYPMTCDNGPKGDDIIYWTYYEGQTSPPVSPFCAMKLGNGRIYTSPNFNTELSVVSSQTNKSLYCDGIADSPGDDWSHSYTLTQNGSNWLITEVTNCINQIEDCS